MFNDANKQISTLKSISEECNALISWAISSTILLGTVLLTSSKPMNTLETNHEDFSYHQY